MDTSHEDLQKLLPKAREYGAADIRIMGFAMQELLSLKTLELGEEAAIAFYLLGKIARLFGAYEKGEASSDDTWHDITVYSLMGRRIRENGGRWP
jgi:hypothetical protein